MQIVNAPQGSPEWHAHRAQSLNASDAPAMMGCSPYKTRGELVRQMATGVTAEVDPATQRRFDDGHRYEELARPLAEQEIGEELYPVVGYTDWDTSAGMQRLSASFDGLTMLEDVAFEHKALNDTLRAAMLHGCTGADLPLMYRVQMEQQLAVSGAGRVLFMATNWDADGVMLESRQCWYEPDMALRAQIMTGWALLLQDVAAYQADDAAPAAEVMEPARTPENLPALLIEVSGSVVRSNLEPFRQHALAVIGEINTDLQTDQDFADAEATVKWLRDDVAAQLKAAKQHAMAQAADIDALFRAVDSVIEAADSKRLQLDKLVKTRKDQIRAEMIGSAQAALDQHVAGLNARIGQKWIGRTIGAFADSIKGKRSLDSMRDAIDAELARCKIDTSAMADTLQANREALRGTDDGHDWMFLFADFATVGLKPAEDFAAIAAQRIAQHQQAEAERKRREEEAAARAADVVRRASIPVPQTAPPPEPIALVRAPAEPRQQADDGARIRLGQINERLAPVSISADGLAVLGFQPVATDKSAKLYRACDLPAICAALVQHINAVAQGVIA